MQAEGGGGYYSVRRLQMKMTFNSQEHQKMKSGKYQEQLVRSYRNFNYNIRGSTIGTRHIEVYNKTISDRR